LAQRLLELPQDSANARRVDFAPANAPQRPRVFDVLRSTRQDFGDEQVLEVDQRNGGAGDVDRTRAPEEILLQP